LHGDGKVSQGVINWSDIAGDQYNVAFGGGIAGVNRIPVTKRGGIVCGGIGGACVLVEHVARTDIVLPDIKGERHARVIGIHTGDRIPAQGKVVVRRGVGLPRDGFADQCVGGWYAVVRVVYVNHFTIQLVGQLEILQCLTVGNVGGDHILAREGRACGCFAFGPNVSFPQGHQGGGDIGGREAFHITGVIDSQLGPTKLIPAAHLDGQGLTQIGKVGQSGVNRYFGRGLGGNKRTEWQQDGDQLIADIAAYLNRGSNRVLSVGVNHASGEVGIINGVYIQIGKGLYDGFRGE